MSEASDRVAANVLFENDRVRVWDDRADPGETKQLHVHRRPYITAIITGEQGETVGEDGTVQRHFDGLKPGDALYVGRTSFQPCTRCATRAPPSSWSSSSSC